MSPRILLAAASLVAILAPSPVFATNYFTEPRNTLDVLAGDPDKAAIDFLTGHHVATGHIDGTFRPDQTVTRGEFLKMAIEGRGKGRDALRTLATTKFIDVPVSYTLAPYVAYATSKGIISGYPDGTFRPGAPVSRAEAAKMALNVYSACATNAPASPYVDLGASTLKGHANRAYALNWLRPEGDRFSPDEALLRRETAQLVYRAILSLGADTPDFDNEPAFSCVSTPYTAGLPEPLGTGSAWELIYGGDKFMIPLPAAWRVQTSGMEAGIDPTMDFYAGAPSQAPKHASEAIIFAYHRPNASFTAADMDSMRALPQYAVRRVHVGKGAFIDAHEYVVFNGDRVMTWEKSGGIYAAIYHEGRRGDLLGVFYRFAQVTAAVN